MTMWGVLETTLAAFQDDDIGLIPCVQTLIGNGAPSIRTDFVFGKWTVRQALRDSRTPSVTIRPAIGSDEIAIKQVGHANGVQAIEVAVEYFDADPGVRQDAIAVIQAALLMVLYELVDYSGEHGGTIIDIAGDAVTRYGEFESPASALGAGFITQFTINESERA